MDQSTVGPPEPDEADADARDPHSGHHDAPVAPMTEDHFDPIRRLKELQERLGFGDLAPAAADTGELTPAEPEVVPAEAAAPSPPPATDELSAPADVSSAPATRVDTPAADTPVIDTPVIGSGQNDPASSVTVASSPATPTVDDVLPTAAEPDDQPDQRTDTPATPPGRRQPAAAPTAYATTPTEGTHLTAPSAGMPEPAADPFAPRGGTPADLLPPPSSDPRSAPPPPPPPADDLPLPPSITPAATAFTEDAPPAARFVPEAPPPPAPPAVALPAVAPPAVAPPAARAAVETVEPLHPVRSYAFPAGDEVAVAPEQPPARAPGAPPQRRWGIAALAFISGLLGTLLAVGALMVFGILEPSGNEGAANTTLATAPPVTIIERITTELVPTEGGGAAVAIAVGQKVIPSIVTVQTNAGSGSGVVISSDGYIVSNDHVIAGATDFFVAFNDGRTYEATLIGSDPLTDLAVLRVESTELVPIEIGMTDRLTIGDTAIAVGSPLGLEGGPSLTVGVLSAFDRSVNVGPDPTDVLFGMLQTDAPITLGSSGGALVNQSGQLIGITTAIGVSSAGAEGIGFATPAEIVMRVVDEIIEIGSVRHAFLGVSLGDHVVQEPDGSTTPGGSLVSELVGDSAAGDAGIQPGDIIVRFDDTAVRNRQDLIVGLRRYRVGDVVEFEVIRAGEPLVFSVELRQRPEEL